MTMKKLLVALFLLMPLSAQAQVGQTVSYGSPCTTAQVASRQFKNAPGYLFEFQVNNWSTSVPLTVFLIDATSSNIPTSGQTITVPIAKTYSLPVAPESGVASGVNATWIPNKLNFGNGILVLCSSTGPTTYTASSTCTMSGATQ
jgi:hypothetical protein